MPAEKRGNMVYHLQINVHSNGFENLKEENSYHADLFSSLDEALKNGKEYLSAAIRRLYEASDYCTGEKDGLTMDDFIRDKMVNYHFTVTEIDLELLQTYNPREKIPDTMPGVYHPQNRPSHTEYTYDLNGGLLWRNYVYHSDTGHPCAYLHVREGDELPGAGTKFK